MITRQIGWSNESNLLYQILKQITRLTSTLFSLKEATIPKYKVFTALLSQDVQRPQDFIIVEMENTIGNIGLQYAGIGTFLVTSDHLFSSIDKCFVIMPSMMSSSISFSTNAFVGIRTTFQNDSAIQLETYAIENGITKADGYLINAPIEIRIYN